MSRRGWALFLTMSVIWGIPYLLIKVAVDEVSPVMLVFARCVIGAALLLPWTLAKGQLRPALRHWRALLLFTLLEMAGPWFLIRPFALFGIRRSLKRFAAVAARR